MLTLAALAAVLLTAATSPTADAGSSSAFDLATSFSTKTAYWDQSKISQCKDDDWRKDEKKYTLVQVQQVVRHGTRFPTDGNIAEITDLVTRLQANHSAVLPKWLQTYTVPYNASVEGLLAPAGAVELEAFGQRTRAQVGKVLPAAFTSDKFILQHTYKPRTKDSAYAFAKTFFANPQEVKYIEYTKKNDPLLRFYDQCPKYTRDVEENPNATIEVAKYKQTPAFQKNIETLRKALNLPQDAVLTTVDVESAFSGCAFDVALYKTSSNWCTLLTPEFIKSVEYAEDLETFYQSSYGNKLSYEISAVLLQDVFKFMKDFTVNKTQVVGNFRFSHAETTLPLMTLLGYGDKTKLVADWSNKDIERRKFRASRLAPFMANLEFRLYKKTKKDDDDDEDKFYVQIRINEQVTAVPGCDDKVFCKLDKVAEIWDKYLTKYDYVAECKI